MNLVEKVSPFIHEVKNFPKEGVVFRDMMPLLRNASLFQEVLNSMEQTVRPLNVQHVVGIESRGFLLGVPLALQLGVPFVPARKKGKLPGPLVSETYALEYGADVLEIQRDALHPGQNYLIVDDVIATGGTAQATARLIEKSQAHVCGFVFLIALEFLKGKGLIQEAFPKAAVSHLLRY